MTTVHGGDPVPWPDTSGALFEHPRWDGRTRRWYWVDIPAGLVHAREADGTLLAWPVPAPVGCLACTADPRILIVAGGLRLGRLDTSDGSWRPFATAPGDPSVSRINDGAVDPAGRLWFGTLRCDYAWEGGALHRLEAGGAISTVVDRVSIANGLDWWQGRMLFADSTLRRIDGFAWDSASGAVNGRSVLSTLAEGMPDGLVVDREGGLWVAVFGGACVLRLDAHSGSILQRLDLPVSLPTAVELGGEAGDCLLITTARDHAPMPASRRPEWSGRILCVALDRPLARPRTLCAG